MHIGVSVGRTPLPTQIEAIDRYLEYAGPLELDAIELDFSVQGHFPNYAPLPYPWDDAPAWAEARKRLDAFVLAGAHLPFQDTNPFDANESVAQDALFQHVNAIERAGDLGLLYAVIHMLGAPAGAGRETWVPLWTDYLGGLSEFARRAGIILCVENTSHGFFLRDLAQVLRQIDSPWLRMTLDIGHAAVPGSRTAQLTGCAHEGYESMDDFVRREFELIYSLHIHDNDGRSDQHLMLGDGAGDFGYLRTLHALGFAGPWILEHYVEDWARLPTAVGRLRDLVGSMDAGAARRENESKCISWCLRGFV